MLEVMFWSDHPRDHGGTGQAERTAEQRPPVRWVRAIISAEPAHLVATEPVDPRGGWARGVCGREFLASVWADDHEPRCQDCAATTTRGNGAETTVLPRVVEGPGGGVGRDRLPVELAERVGRR